MGLVYSESVLCCHPLGGWVAKKDKGIAVGDRVLVNLHHGKFEEGTVKTVITRTDGVRYQIDLGEDRTALVHEWQIRRD